MEQQNASRAGDSQAGGLRSVASNVNRLREGGRDMAENEKWVIIKQSDGSIRGTADRLSEAYIKAWNGDIIRKEA